MTAFASVPTLFGSRFHISSQGGKETGAKAFLYSGRWSVTCMRRLSPQAESRTFLSCSLTCNERIVLTLVDYLLNFGNNLNLIGYSVRLVCSIIYDEDTETDTDHPFCCCIMQQ